jgi:hypothetical protein
LTQLRWWRQNRGGAETLTEHGFQDAFKKCQKHWKRCICAEVDYFEGDGGKLAQS